MGFNSMAVGLLEKSLSKAKDMSLYLVAIRNELRRDNIAVTVDLDTSVTALTKIKLDSLVGGHVRGCTVLDPGGGLYLQTSIGEPFEVFEGDKILNESIEILRWKGAGAGTAVLRITGLRL